jgi:hypothetical protein
MMLTDLGAAFDAAGLPWVGVGASPYDPTGAADWTTRGRPASTGDFRPSGILCHHTASPAGTSPQADLNCILAGNANAPGPISQLAIGRDAVLQVVAAGRANHGGRGMRPGIDSSCADMNLHLLGIEVSNDGMGEPWSDAVIDTYGRTVAALVDWYGWPLEAVYLHATTGPPSGGCNSKIDPAGPWRQQPDLPGGGAGTWDLDVWRSFVAAVGAQPLPPEGEEMTEADWQRMQVLIHDQILDVVRSTEFTNNLRAYAAEGDRAVVAEQLFTDVVQIAAHTAGLGLMRSEEFAAILAVNTGP